MPSIGASIDIISGGIPPGSISLSCSGSWACSASVSVPVGSIVAMRSDMVVAIGNTICCHTGAVFTNHSDRDHTLTDVAVTGKVTAGSSHVSASSIAACTARTSESDTTGSPPLELIPERATCITVDHGSGPSCWACCSIWPNWVNMAPRLFILKLAPPGP